jgi:NAD(P)-dependent dehydrogenase (short-subunit alcohol dehydrogenase family)
MKMPDPHRTVLITGAANGLGRAMSIGLLEQGFSVAAVDRDANGLAALREQAAAGSRFEGFVADLTDFDAEKLAADVEKRFGRIDILINNAGLGQREVRTDYHKHPPKFYEVTPGQWSRAIAVNANAVFFLSRAVVKPMIERKWGRIINITTSLGTMLHGGSMPYGPTKASGEALSSVMAGDLEGTGVTVNVIIPGGAVNTPMIPAEAPFARDALLQPGVMLPPLLWLVSSAADRVTGKRFLGMNWDAALAPDAAAEKAGAPIGWKALAVLPVRPKF